MAKMVWKDSEQIKQEEIQQKKQTEHQEKKQMANTLIMVRMVTDYILSDDLPDEEKDMFINLFDLWEPNTAYSKGSKVVYEGIVYEVIQAHTSQSDWLPNELPALYNLFYQTSTDDGTIVIPEWKQPLGGHDVYNTGDLVLHEGVVWVSEVDNNVWAPGEYGWIELEDELEEDELIEEPIEEIDPEPEPEDDGEEVIDLEVWTQPLGAHDAYTEGDVVVFEGNAYMSDVSGNVWAPNAYGWTLIE